MMGLLTGTETWVSRSCGCLTYKMQGGSESITHAVMFTNHEYSEEKPTKRNSFDRENIREIPNRNREIKVFLKSVWSVSVSS